MKSTITNIISRTGKGKEATVAVLQAIQQHFNYLPEEALKMVCENTDITPAEIVGVASFYPQFRFHPAGKHMVKVCAGTACHVKGAELVYDALKRTLKLTEEEDTDADRNFTLEKVNCLGCCTIAPAVQIDNITYGRVNPASAKDIIDDFISRNNNQEEGQKPERNSNETDGEIRIGLGSCCVATGSGDVQQAIEETIIRESLNVNIKHVGCVGMCHQVPLVEVLPADRPPQLYAKVKPEDIRHLIRRHFRSSNRLIQLRNNLLSLIENIQYSSEKDDTLSYAIDIREKQVAAFLGNQIPVATEHRGILNPTDAEEYILRGGFSGLKRALEMEPAAIISEVKSSGIRGRGGAGYPTGLKWEAVARQQSEIKYLICNGDEGDPGAFMDRMLMESYPYRIIEGMLIAARATGAGKGFFYIRAEYPLAVIRVKEALEKCSQMGYLGENICGSGFSFYIDVRESAGAFVCGEETALIASMEGKRGFPRLRPPYPAQEGLWGKPTLINNTETLAQIPFILDKGAEAFSSIGTARSKGTKVFALAGKVYRGGLIEVPMGITIAHIVEEIGGGVQKGRKLKAVQVGGPSGGCIPASMAHSSIDFESLDDAGAIMGSGGLVVLDESDCMVDIARYFLAFTQQESCGKCTFCRIGTRRMLDILEKLCSGQAADKDLKELETLAGWTKRGSLCGLGKTAPNPVISTLRHFHEEYLAHLEGRCPAGKCKDLITYSITDKCIGCTICAQQCPVEAIPFNPHKKHEINCDLCVKCDNCRRVCPEDAIDVT